MEQEETRMAAGSTTAPGTTGEETRMMQTTRAADGSALFKRADGSMHKCWPFQSADGSTRCRSCGLHPDQCPCKTHPASCGCDTMGYTCRLHGRAS